jgi:hypothetical protein
MGEPDYQIDVRLGTTDSTIHKRYDFRIDQTARVQPRHPTMSQRVLSKYGLTASAMLGVAKTWWRSDCIAEAPRLFFHCSLRRNGDSVSVTEVETQGFENPFAE